VLTTKELKYPASPNVAQNNYTKKSHYNIGEPKVNSNPFIYIFEDFLGSIFYISYFSIFYILAL